MKTRYLSDTFFKKFPKSLEDRRHWIEYDIISDNISYQIWEQEGSILPVIDEMSNGPWTLHRIDKIFYFVFANLEDRDLVALVYL